MNVPKVQCLLTAATFTFVFCNAFAAPVNVSGVNQCVGKKIEQSPAGFQNRCNEAIVLHFKDMHQAYQVMIPPGQTKNPNPMGEPYYACPEYIQGRKITFDWPSRSCQAK